MKTYKPHSSSFGDASANLISILCYVSVMMFWVVGIVPVLVIFFVEKKSGLVRFHSIQAMLLWLARTFLGGGITFESVATILTGNASYLQSEFGWGGSLDIILVRIVVDALVLVFACIALVYAYNWKDWKIPVIGLLAKLICRGCNPVAYNGGLEVPYICQIGVDSERLSQQELQYAYANPQYAPVQQPEQERGNEMVEHEMKPETTSRVADYDEPADARRSRSEMPGEYEPRVQNNPEESRGRTGETSEIEKPAPAGEKKKPEYVLDKSDPVYKQLPKDMRDPPLPHDMYSTGPSEVERAGYSSDPSSTALGTGPKMVQAPLKHEANSDAPQLFAGNNDPDELFDRMMMQNQHVTVIDRAVAWFGRANKPVVFSLPKSDPNSSLPPDMRDPKGPPMI